MYFNSDTNSFRLNKPRIIKKQEIGNVFLCDLETCNEEKTLFDFSYRICSTKEYKVLQRGSCILKESWLTTRIINGIYSKKKKKAYKQYLEKGVYKQITREELNELINVLIRKYDIKIFCAYNGAFDLESLVRTLSIENKRSKHFKNKVLNEDSLLLRLHLLDIGVLCKCYYETEDFQEWYDKNIKEYNKDGTRKVNCEIMAKYALKDDFFIEEHTGQRDLDVEYQLLMCCLGREDIKQVVLNWSMCWGVRLLATKKLKPTSKTYRICCDYDMDFLKQTYYNKQVVNN